MKNRTLIIILIAVVLAFFIFKKKRTGATNNKSQKKSVSGSKSSSEKGSGNSIQDIYDPQYSVLYTGCEIMTSGVNATYACITVKDKSYKYKLSQEKMKEIIFYVDCFINDLCNTPNGFMVEYINFFKGCNQEELDFAQDVLSMKGYVLKDRAGDTYLVESFEQVLTDPLQKEREGIEEWYSLFRN